MGNFYICGCFVGIGRSFTILPGDLCLDHLASALHFRKKMFISRSGAAREELPAILASQSPDVENSSGRPLLKDPTPSLVPIADLFPWGLSGNLILMFLGTSRR